MILELGRKFSSYQEVSDFINAYEQSKYVKFWKREARLIASARSNSFVKPELKYCELKYTCIFGGKKFKSTGKNIREVRTFKKENPCPAFIFFKPTGDGRFLQICKFSEKHNHEVSQESFAILCQQRKSSETRERAKNLVALRTNSQTMHQVVNQNPEDYLTLKDLLKAQQKSEKCLEAVEACAKALMEKYHCEIALLKDSSRKLRGLFLQTVNMKRIFEGFPEFVGVDATYKLVNVVVHVLAITVEDGNRHTEIVALCLLATEDRDSIEWFVKIFKEKNPAWRDVKSIMVDKDLLQKDIVIEHFPEAEVHCSIFHCMKVFAREIKTEIFNISEEKREQILAILQKMVTAKSDREFDILYDDLKACAPRYILVYFYKNWYSVRHEWSMCAGYFKYAFLNASDSRIDAINAQLKKNVNKNNRLEDFLEVLFNAFHSLESKRDFKMICKQQKRLVTGYDSTSAEKKYMECLTCESAKIIVHNLESSKKISSDRFVIKDKCLIYKSGESSSIATSDRCNCNLALALLMPCKHIFLLRRVLDLPLFSPSLIHKRWTVDHYKNVQVILKQYLDQVSESTEESVIESGSGQKLSYVEKRRKAMNYLRELANVAAQADDNVFEERLQDVKDLLTFWRSGVRTQVTILDGEENHRSNSYLMNDALDDTENMHNSQDPFDDVDSTSSFIKVEDQDNLNGLSSDEVSDLSHVKNEEFYYVVMENDNAFCTDNKISPNLTEVPLSTKKRGRPRKTTNECSKRKKHM